MTLVEQQQSRDLNLTALPDELIAMCYAGLPASDLVTLELVSPRLHTLIANDGLCWKNCTLLRWRRMFANPSILPAAARHARSWKNFYSEKAVYHLKYTPWLVATPSETRAIIDIITTVDSTPEAASSSPSKVSDPTEDKPQHSTPLSVPATPPTAVASTIMAATPPPVSVTSSASPVSVMPVPPPAASASLSVVLLIDASSSVTDDDFNCMKSFCKKLVSALCSQPHQSCVNASIALVQFNQQPRIELSLTAAQKPKVMATIDAMEQLMGSTDIAAPIRRARQMLLEDAAPGDRAIILLTDGQTHADELNESEREVRKAAEEAGARVYTLGVGRDIDETGLARVAAGSPGGMYFTLRRFVHIR